VLMFALPTLRKSFALLDSYLLPFNIRLLLFFTFKTLQRKRQPGFLERSRLKPGIKDHVSKIDSQAY